MIWFLSDCLFVWFYFDKNPFAFAQNAFPQVCLPLQFTIMEDRCVAKDEEFHLKVAGFHQRSVQSFAV